jgi:gamma-glutamylcyclotransferase (GGCT)/AIG2-like uncharacterized protein YtfP
MNGERDLVFVYGTLRRGASNHFRMAGADFVAAGTVRGRMYRIDWYPGLVLDGGGDWIHGEVYAVREEILTALDVFEGVSAHEVDGAEYRRVRAEVRTTSGASLVAWVWEWLGRVEETSAIPGGDWLAVDAG